MGLTLTSRHAPRVARPVFLSYPADGLAREIELRDEILDCVQ